MNGTLGGNTGYLNALGSSLEPVVTHVSFQNAHARLSLHGTRHEIPRKRVIVNEHNLQIVLLCSFPQAVGRRGTGEQLLKAGLSPQNHDTEGRRRPMAETCFWIYWCETPPPPLPPPIHTHTHTQLLLRQGFMQPSQSADSMEPTVAFTLGSFRLSSQCWELVVSPSHALFLLGPCRTAPSLLPRSPAPIPSESQIAVVY